MNIRRKAGWLLVLGMIGCFSLVLAKERSAVKKKEKEAVKEAVMSEKIEKVVKTEAEWKKILSPEQYEVLRKQGTERAFTGKYWNTHEKGNYVCAACGFKLFESEDKFDSHCGWPSFSKPVSPKAVESREDRSHLMVRTEVTCPRCGGHLGHVFEDGPQPSGLRYCINSASIDFKAEEEKKEKKEKDKKP